MRSSKVGRKVLKYPLSILMSAVVLGMMTTSIDAQAATHTVQPGEYLYSIASQYGVTVNQLREWNKLTSDMLQVNDVLFVTATEEADDTEAETAPTEADSLESVPVETSELDEPTDPVEESVEESTEEPAENPESIQPTAPVEATDTTLQATDPDYSTGTVIIHLVKPGEYLNLIARNYGVTANELRLWNHLTSDALSIGQELKIIPGTVGEPQVPLPPPASGATYLVKAGDTLWSIAQRYGLTVNQLQTWNNLTSNVLTVGQTLRMTAPTTTPPPPATGTTYTVKAGDSLWSIGQRFGVTVSQLQSWNNLSTNFLSVGQVLRLTAPTTTPPPATGTTYTVKAGDSLWSIGQRFGVTVNQLRTWNNLTSNVLAVGQRLKVTGEVTPTPPPTTAYTVKAGDTLWSISTRYGVSVTQLKQWNNLTSNFLSVGQRLTVTSPSTTYTVKSGDSLWKIATQFGVTVQNLKDWNGLTSNVIYTNQRLIVK